MKKKIVIIIVILLLLLCGTLIKFYPFGNTKYYLKEEKMYLNVPKLSIYETTKNKNTVIFSSFRSKSSITNEFIVPSVKNEVNHSYSILLASKIIQGIVPNYYGGQIETKSNILNVPLK